MNSTSSSQARSGTGHYHGDWDAKSLDELVRKPFYLHRWFRRSVFVLACTAGLAAAALLWCLDQRLQERAADLAGQRRSLEAFIDSKEFASFGRASAAQLLATLNFAVAQPTSARSQLPDVAAWENTHRTMPWTLELRPLPVSAPPVQVIDQGRTASALLLARGFVFDELHRRAARRLFVHALEPYVKSFVERAPENNFAALGTDPSLQDTALAALAGHIGHGTTVSDLERLYVLYAALGPEMWRTIERDSLASR